MTSPFVRNLSRSITITNVSGSTQSYALFAALPVVTPAVSDMENNIILVLRGVASMSGQAYFTIPKAPMYAICGTSYGGETTVETRVEVLDTRPVQPGLRGDDGVLVPGTTLELILRKGTPNFANKVDTPPSGDEGCFCIRTCSEFTHSEARAGKSRPEPPAPTSDITMPLSEIQLTTAQAGNFVVGISLFKKLSRYIGPFAMFRPAPGMEYQIKLCNQFYLAVGDYDARGSTLKGLENRSCLVDFDKLELDDVQVQHTENGRLIVKSDFNED